MIAEKYPKTIKYAKFACVAIAAIGIATTAYVAGIQTLYGIRGSDIASTAWKHFIEPITRFGHTSYLEPVLFGMEVIGLNIIGKSAYQKIKSLFQPKEEMLSQHQRGNASPNFQKNPNFTNKFNPNKPQPKKKKTVETPEPNMPASQNENFVNASTARSKAETDINNTNKVLDTIAQIRKKREGSTSVSSLKI